MPVIRILGSDDLPLLHRFFLRHSDTTLFMQSNLAEAGIEVTMHARGGLWVGQLDEHGLESVATHFNGGNLIVAGSAADEGLIAAARLAVNSSRRPLRGIVGPWGLVEAVGEGLAIDAPPSLRSKEALYALQLKSLVSPQLLASGTVRCRRSEPEELPVLMDWRVAYQTETLSRVADAAAHREAEASIRGAHELGRLFVLDDASGALLSTTAFNAQTDSVVQVGGVFTPPQSRGRGWARCAVAGSLELALAQGVSRSILFTGEHNRFAQRAYEALGYERVGDYGLLLY